MAADILRDGELVILGRIPSASNTTLVCDAVIGGADPGGADLGGADADGNELRLSLIHI